MAVGTSGVDNTVKVVTAYVDLGLTKRPSEQFHVLGRRLVACCPNIRVFDNFPFEDCWTVKDGLAKYPPANPRAEDRFATTEEHLRSNLIQHCPVQWVHRAAAEDPEPDVFVWIGYSVLKQGDFTGKPVREADIQGFLEQVKSYDFKDIPFPGITAKGPANPFGDNWRFCGSVVIFPRLYLHQMVRMYQDRLHKFVAKYKAIPLDLAIWPDVERFLPFRFYQAEYDRTQFTNFPVR